MVAKVEGASLTVTSRGGSGEKSETFTATAETKVLIERDETELVGSSRLDALRECLGTRDDTGRHVLVLKYEHVWKSKAIAAETGRSLDAVYQLLGGTAVRLLLSADRRTVLEIAQGGGKRENR